MKMAFSLTGWLLISLAVPLTSAWAQKPERPKRYTIWDIQLGETVSALPNEFIDYACGTNGGPPSIPLPNFAAFKTCKPDASGLREVDFKYDDELEYEARALNNKPEIKMYAGTTVFEFPVIASVLFDDAGVVRGERMVTDPRQQVSRDRLEFWELGNFIRQRFDDDHWTCTDLPPDDGERPVGSRFVKNHCEKVVSGMHLILEQHLFQKKGQEFMDPATGKAQLQAFESSTRFTMYDATLPVQTPDPK